MRLLLPAVMLSVCGVAAAQVAPAGAGTVVPVAAGTKLPLVVVRALPRKGAAPHDAVYAETLAAVVRNGRVLIPAGTQVQGEVELVKQPGWFHPHGTLVVHFPEALLGNNYVLPLDDTLSGTEERVELTVDVTIASPFLLDTGTTFDLPLRTATTVDVSRLPVAGSGPGIVLSSSRCKPAAGVPGTPDTVIPGTPSTPDTVIPGVNGAPPTVIPGTPATPPTVFPGTPGTPGTVCPEAPRVSQVVLLP